MKNSPAVAQSFEPDSARDQDRIIWREAPPDKTQREKTIPLAGGEAYDAPMPVDELNGKRLAGTGLIQPAPVIPPFATAIRL